MIIKTIDWKPTRWGEIDFKEIVLADLAKAVDPHPLQFHIVEVTIQICER